MIKCPICQSELNEFTIRKELVAIEEITLRIYPCNTCGYINKFSELRLEEYLLSQPTLELDVLSSTEP